MAALQEEDLRALTLQKPLQALPRLSKQVPGNNHRLTVGYLSGKPVALFMQKNNIYVTTMQHLYNTYGTLKRDMGEHMIP